MRLRFVPALLAAALLAGCSIPFTTEPDPLEDATAVYSWQAEGRMIFECTYDAEGFYWAFVRPEGKLASETGRVEATIENDFGLTHRDGSHLEAKIIRQGAAKTPNDLKDTLFEVSSASDRGALRAIRYVERRRAEGGMPLTACSASQRGMRLAVPFRARWILYR